MSSGHRATTVLSTVGTVVASAMLIRSIVNDFVPDEARDYLTSSLRFVSQHFSRQFTIKIEEFRGFSPNQVFEAGQGGEGRERSLSAALKHPMSFETLALDPELKTTVLEDLENFVAGKDYYQKIGRAWKRGYLLYGPPGTRKSSLIAAMANHLNFDIYDMDLSSVNSNTHLKILMLGMSSRSMLVVEDIDCSVGIQNRELQDDEEDSEVTLSGLLNFVDGLWSCCKEARILVFTTNHPERLDPALLRPGRMDVHICLSYCTVAVFKQLADNYLGLPSHPLFEEIEPLVEVAKVTPAEVGGELMKHREPEASLRGLVDFLTNKIKLQEEDQ